MALLKCLVCLQNSTEIPPECVEFSKQLFAIIRSEIWVQVNRLEPDSGISSPFCSRCRVYLMRFAKLNDRMMSLASGLRQLNVNGIGIVRRMNLLQAQVGISDNEGQADVHCDTNTSCNSNSKKKVEDRTVPKKYPRQKIGESVQQVSEKHFIFKGKYPFERMELSFKCGSCPAISKLSRRKGFPIWYSMMSHINIWHAGSGRIRKTKIPQSFIEIAPGRLQYGKYLIEKHGGKYECLTCSHLASSGPQRDKFKYIRVHICRKHERT